jgi:mannose-6-phosphate isomerase-like protein (cupin superfamily)
MLKSPVVIPTSERPSALDVFGTKVTVLATSSDNGCYGITYQKGGEGEGPPPHHHGWDEAFYVLTGTVHFLWGGEEHDCPPGTIVHVPRNTVHGFNYGKGGGSMLEITSRESRAAEMFTQVDDEIDPANPDISKAVAILKKNGVIVA